MGKQSVVEAVLRAKYGVPVSVRGTKTARLDPWMAAMIDVVAAEQGLPKIEIASRLLSNSIVGPDGSVFLIPACRRLDENLAPKTCKWLRRMKPIPKRSPDFVSRSRRALAEALLNYP